MHTRGLQTAGPDATRQAVDSLINEQLLVKSALDNKLDRDPAVVQALERARRQVLARAYVERLVFPTEDDQRRRAGRVLQEASGAVREAQDVSGYGVHREGRGRHAKKSAIELRQLHTAEEVEKALDRARHRSRIPVAHARHGAVAASKICRASRPRKWAIS